MKINNNNNKYFNPLDGKVKSIQKSLNNGHAIEPRIIIGYSPHDEVEPNLKKTHHRNRILGLEAIVM